jgi:hypothetical protein
MCVLKKYHTRRPWMSLRVHVVWNKACNLSAGFDTTLLKSCHIIVVYTQKVCEFLFVPVRIVRNHHTRR